VNLTRVYLYPVKYHKVAIINKNQKNNPQKSAKIIYFFRFSIKQNAIFNPYIGVAFESYVNLFHGVLYAKQQKIQEQRFRFAVQRPRLASGVVLRP
jgi:hypothetical protein